MEKIVKKKNSNTLKDANTLTYTLNGFSIRSFTLVEPGMDIIPSINEKNIQLGFSLDFAFNTELGVCRVLMNIGYNFNPEGNSNKLLEIELLSEFIIRDFEKVIDIQSDVLGIPHQLLIMFTSITYSTARGIIFSKTQGSYLNKFILPVIDPDILVQNALKQKGVQRTGK